MSTGQHESVLCVLGCRSPSGHPWPAAAGGYLACHPCGDRLRDALAEILEKYPQLMDTDTLLHRDTPDSGRPVKGYASAPPASVHLLAMRDHHTVAEQPGDPHSPFNVLWWWATQVRRLHHTQPPAGPVTIAGEAATLRFHWDWILRQRWLAALAEDLREVVRQLRVVLPDGQRPRRPVGTCTQQTGTGATLSVCGGPLFLPHTGKIITCPWCGHDYQPATLITLYHAQQQAGP